MAGYVSLLCSNLGASKSNGTKEELLLIDVVAGTASSLPGALPVW